MPNFSVINNDLVRKKEFSASLLVTINHKRVLKRHYSRNNEQRVNGFDTPRKITSTKHRLSSSNNLLKAIKLHKFHGKSTKLVLKHSSQGR